MQLNCLLCAICAILAPSHDVQRYKLLKISRPSPITLFHYATVQSAL